MTKFHELTDDEADAILVRRIYKDVKAKLAASRAKGKNGWHSEMCSNDYLMTLLIDHIEKGDMRDVIAIAGMIHLRKVNGFD